MRKLTTAIAGLLLAMMAFGQVNEEVVDGKKLIHRVVERPQFRHSASRQRDRQKRQMDAGPVAGSPAGLQTVGLPEEAVFAHKGTGTDGGLLQALLNDRQIGLQALFRVHNGGIEIPQLGRGRDAQTPVEQIGGHLIALQRGGIPSLLHQRAHY